MKLTDDQIRKMADSLLGTADSVERGLAALDLDADDYDVDEIEEALATASVERCQACDWWFESGELVSEDDDDEPGFCDDCRPGAIEGGGRVR